MSNKNLETLGRKIPAIESSISLKNCIHHLKSHNTDYAVIIDHEKPLAVIGFGDIIETMVTLEESSTDEEPSAGKELSADKEPSAN